MSQVIGALYGVWLATKPARASGKRPLLRASQRRRLAQPKQCSTTHRLGCRTTPFLASGSRIACSSIPSLHAQLLSALHLCGPGPQRQPSQFGHLAAVPVAPRNTRLQSRRTDVPWERMLLRHFPSKPRALVSAVRPVSASRLLRSLGVLNLDNIDGQIHGSQRHQVIAPKQHASGRKSCTRPPYEARRAEQLENGNAGYQPLRHPSSPRLTQFRT